jgi:hemerythrin superfamily protein
MDSVDVLLLEHSIIRLKSKELSEIKNALDGFIPFNEFVINCHAKHEDEIVFPILMKKEEDDQEFIKYVKRISADHKLIATLGGNIEKWINEKNFEMLERRIPLYFKTLLEHNLNEEKDIFVRWKPEYAVPFKHIINSFGAEKYRSITGASDEMILKYYL